MSNIRQFNLLGNRRPAKRVVYGVISVVSEDSEDADLLEIKYIFDRNMALAIDYGDFSKDYIFDHKVNEKDKRYKMPDGEDSIPHLVIIEDKVPKYISKERGVASCAYNATNEYMKHWLGRSMDRHDSAWYSKNSLVTPNGLPQANSFTVIQQLVEPYNVSISKIIVPKNTRRFPEYIPFIKALGANPFFVADGKTTNEEAYNILYPETVLSAMGLDGKQRSDHKKEQFSKWRFECGDQPYRGAIIMRQFNHESTGHNGGSVYIGVRDKTNLESWWMAIKLDESDKVDYVQPLELPEYEEWEGLVSYRFEQIRDATGKTLSQIKSEIYSNRAGISRGLSAPSLIQKSKEEEEPELVMAYNPICLECKKKTGDNVYVDNERVCQHCGTKVEKRLVPVESVLDGWDVIGDDLPALFDIDVNKDSWWF